MTADELIKSALHSFGRNGFEGASLAKIAEEVGIKKQSIYTHFKNKDELFLKVLEYSLDEDYSYLLEWSDQNQHQSLHDYLFGYLQLIAHRFSEEDSYRFGLKISFFPPDHLNQAVKEQVAIYEENCERLFLCKFKQAVEQENISITNIYSAHLAYVCMLDAIFVELMYGTNERAALKLDAIWSFYWRGLTS